MPKSWVPVDWKREKGDSDLPVFPLKWAHFERYSQAVGCLQCPAAQEGGKTIGVSDRAPEHLRTGLVGGGVQAGSGPVLYVGNGSERRHCIYKVCVLTVFPRVFVCVPTCVHGRNSEAMPEPSEGVGPAGTGGGSRPQVRAPLTLGAAVMQNTSRLPPELSTKGYMQDLADNSLSFGLNEKAI